MASILGRIGASLLGFFVGGFCGGMVAQVLAVSTGATEEYILVFVVTAAIAFFVTLPFFVAQFFDPPRRALDKVAISLAASLVILVLGLAGWTLLNPSANGGDWGIIAGLTLPNLTTIGAHWLVVRAMQPRMPPAPFGRKAGLEPGR